MSLENRQAFTLIELSIALVIIGLLVGGILVGRNLISSAQISSQVQQIGHFDAAVITFKNKYKYLPGDARGFGGNGNRAIDATTVHWPVISATTFTCEIANFWSQAIPGKYLSTPCTSPGSKAIYKGASKNVPLAKMGKSDSFIVATALTYNGSYVDLTRPANYYVILDRTHVQVPIAGNWDFSMSTSANSAVTPIDLLALDKKMDDGIANLGFVNSAKIGQSFSSQGGGLVANPLTTCSQGADYKIENSGFECTPAIRIGGSIGDRL